MIDLPRQARDKHRKSSKRDAFILGLYGYGGGVITASMAFTTIRCETVIFSFFATLSILFGKKAEIICQDRLAKETKN
jgi:succinate-acetate transporter protein